MKDKEEYKVEEPYQLLKYQQHGKHKQFEKIQKCKIESKTPIKKNKTREKNESVFQISLRFNCFDPTAIPLGIVVVRGDCDLETCRMYIDRLQEVSCGSF